MARLRAPLARATGTNPFEVRKELQELNWNKVGVARKEPDLSEAAAEIESLAAAAEEMKVTGGSAYNMLYTAALDVRGMLDASRMVAASARLREETRGAHFSRDFPQCCCCRRKGLYLGGKRRW
jgi:succinate dehydrogenase/fumarate reductase flavoprotein subunit